MWGYCYTMRGGDMNEELKQEKLAKIRLNR